MVPCCMKIISCDVYSDIIEDMEENGTNSLGGAVGKNKICPRNAAHAHQLNSGEYFSGNFILDYSLSRNRKFHYYELV